MREKAIVIGAGLAGTVLANDLAEAFDVLLLEKGPQGSYYTPEIRHKRRPLAAVPTFCIGVGGTTNLWHNGLIPLRPEDLSPGPFRDLVEDSRRFMDRAAHALHFPAASSYAAIHSTLLADARTRLHALGGESDSFDCLIYPKRYRPLQPSPQVRVVSGVGELSFVPSGNRVATVDYRVSGASGEERARADVVVVCAGALGTPGILARAIGDLGLAPRNVGSGFIDHPMGFVGKVKIQERYAGLASALASQDHGSFTSQTPIRIRSECGHYTGCAYLRPSVTMGNRLSVHRFKSLLGASRGLSRLRNAFDMRLFHPDILAEAASHLFGLETPGNVYSLLFVGEQKRNGNEVCYQNDQLVVDWTVSDEELGIINEMLGRLGEVLSPIAEEINLTTDIDNEWLWSCAHHSGTTPLGTEADAVVDGDLRLVGTDNVFVCDGSVIQEHSYANTGLTIAQLALGLSHRLKHHA